MIADIEEETFIVVCQLNVFFFDDRYAREDTHYLLYIYDLMRIKLLSMPKESEHCDTPLVEV